MPIHLTPAELAREKGMRPRDVIDLCLKTGVPIYEGRIDRTLLEATLRASAAEDQRTI
jgi:bifunctional DNase/RNase